MLPVNSRALVALAAAAALLTACDRTVVEVVDVANLELNPPAEPVALGNTVQLNAQATSARGEQLSRTVTFSSSDTDIATVSEAGRVTAAGRGTATVTASADGVSATSTIFVVDLLGCGSAGTLRPGDSESATLSTSNCQFGGEHPLAGRFVELWLLHVSSSTAVTIDMTSSFDTLLLLFDQSFDPFEPLAFNDDADASTFDSRITITLAPGAYVIGATSFAVEVTGTYDLSVSS